jgi:hypothetical protein
MNHMPQVNQCNECYSLPGVTMLQLLRSNPSMLGLWSCEIRSKEATASTSQAHRSSLASKKTQNRPKNLPARNHVLGCQQHLNCTSAPCRQHLHNCAAAALCLLSSHHQHNNCYVLQDMSRNECHTIMPCRCRSVRGAWGPSAPGRPQ